MRRLLACLLLLAATSLAATDHPALMAGIYEANIPIKGTAGRKVTLNLAQDGKATMRSELVGKGVENSSGTWSAAGEEVRLEFDGGHPAPMVWHWKKNRLIAKEKGALSLRKPR